MGMHWHQYCSVRHKGLTEKQQRYSPKTHDWRTEWQSQSILHKKQITLIGLLSVSETIPRQCYLIATLPQGTPECGPCEHRPVLSNPAITIITGGPLTFVPTLDCRHAWSAGLRRWAQTNGGVEKTVEKTVRLQKSDTPGGQSNFRRGQSVLTSVNRLCSSAQ